LFSEGAGEGENPRIAIEQAEVAVGEISKNEEKELANSRDRTNSFISSWYSVLLLIHIARFSRPPSHFKRHRPPLSLDLLLEASSTSSLSALFSSSTAASPPLIVHTTRRVPFPLLPPRPIAEMQCRTANVESRRSEDLLLARVGVRVGRVRRRRGAVGVGRTGVEG
jgi:hypothetical protein